MTKRTLLVWAMILVFGIASMPVLGFASSSKQTGNTEAAAKKPKKKKGSKHKKVSKKHKKGNKKRKSAGKKNYSKKVKYSKKKKYSGKKKKYTGKKKKYSSKKKRSSRNNYTRPKYTPPTNSSNVEYRNYKRSSENENSGQDIEKIAPQKEIRKEPKKENEGDNQ